MMPTIRTFAMLALALEHARAPSVSSSSRGPTHGFVPTTVPLPVAKGGTGATSMPSGMVTSNGTSLGTTTSPTGLAIDCALNTCSNLPASGLATNFQWWSPVDQIAQFGTEAGDEGYPVGNPYQFTTQVTITGVRFYCHNGGTQNFTVTAASSTSVAGTRTGLGLKSCASLSVDAVHTCSFTSAIVVTNTSLVYTAGVYGESGVADCTGTVAPTPPGYTVWCSSAATIPCAAGPAVRVVAQNVYGTFHTASSYPVSGPETSRFASAEFVFTVP